MNFSKWVIICIDKYLVSIYNCINMDWIATNIRFPEDLYMELKLEAAKKRKSVAALIREKLAKKKAAAVKKSLTSILQELDNVAKENAKFMKGRSLSKMLIKMRYEQ